MYSCPKTLEISSRVKVKFDEIASGLTFFSPDSFFNSLAFVIGLSLFASAFLLFPLVERVTNAKQVQMMTGSMVTVVEFYVIFNRGSFAAAVLVEISKDFFH